MSNERETQDTKEFKGDIGGVNNRLADSAVNGQYFQVVEGIMPWEDGRRRIFGKKTMGKVWSETSDRLSVITLHALPGNHTLIQTRHGLFMDSPYDPATLDWSIRAGVTGIATLQNVDRLVRALKDANLWGKFIALYPFAGGTSLAHSQNLVNSAHSITWVNGPTHNALGITGNGLTSYGYIPSPNTLPYLGHLSVYVNTPATTFADYRDYMGQGGEGGVGRYHLIQCVNNDYYGYWAEPFKAATITGTGPWTGHLLNTRPDTNTVNAYSKGTLAATASFADAAVMPTTLYIGILCRMDNGNTVAEPSNVTLSLASWGHTMSAPEVAAFNTAVQAYETTMGRQV